MLHPKGNFEEFIPQQLLPMAAIVDHSIGDNMQDPFKEVAVLEHLLAAHSIASNKPNFDSIENSHSCSFGIITNLRLLVPS